MRAHRLFVLSFLGLVGCYDAHGLAARAALGSRDAGPATDDTPVSDAAPTRATNACGVPSETLEVPAGGCTTHTFTDTAGNACDDSADAARRVVHVVRPPSGREWYFLIRSRDRTASEIAMGHLDAESCACRFHASASGGDLTAHGVGGDLGTRDDEIDLVLDGDDGAMWLRICDGPPR